MLLIAGGVPMTFEGNAQTPSTAMGQRGGTQAAVIARGPVAALVAIKQLGTNGGGFFGAELGPPVREPDRVDQPRRVRLHHPDPDGLRW